jgi:ParB/Sulfiredoxin domain
MDAAAPLPDFDAMRRELEEARSAMQRVIEEARAKPEILKIFLRANQISADANVRSRRKRNSTSHYAFREIALRADRLRGQWLKDLEKAGLRYMGRPEEGVKIGTPPPPHLLVLDDLDLGGNAGRRESQDLQLLADMSAAAFEVLVADPDAPRPRSGSEKRILSLSEIRLDERTQPRATLVTDCVAEYAEDMKRGCKFPPLVVFEDSEGVFWLADGFHRYHAAIEAKWETIQCEVHKGELRDAILHSCGVNAVHGLRRSNKDKRRVVRRMLDNEEWSHWTDSEIARRCKVGHDLVARLRAQSKPAILAETQVSTRTFTHPKTGEPTQMRTGNIGRSRAPDPEPEKGSSEQGPEQPQSALPPQESPELAPEPVPEPAPEPVKESAPADDDALAQELAPASKPDAAPTPAGQPAAPDGDVDLPTYFGPNRRRLTLDERLGNLISLTEETIFAFVPAMRAAGRLPELFRRVRKLIDKLEAEAAADGDQTEAGAEPAAVDRVTPHLKNKEAPSV